MKPSPSAPSDAWNELVTVGQRSGGRQEPSKLVELCQPASPPLNPRAAESGGYLLAIATGADARNARRQVAAIKAPRKRGERICFAPLRSSTTG
jgi:hypothetical protein